MKLRPLLLALPLLASPGLAFAEIDVTLDHGSVWQTKKVNVRTEGFIQIHNKGNAVDVLTGANCSIAGSTELVGADGKDLDSLTIQPGQTLTLSADGPHLLMRHLSYTVDYGSILPCSFTFQEAGDLLGYLNATPAPAKK
ncbi:copper chaperone PCu(A)C [Acidocella aromatica]|uniref:Copper(I)-binding protein n=1 Tax=Acidocella aromatica TaxID=1303579 RepID=A0A840VDY3_9PROT|nr:copper chaperone PCu(A)C [Acidocella aromatica]MBB5374068.1 copper(I)-binding protein [Acidocella aromatica]